MYLGLVVHKGLQTIVDKYTLKYRYIAIPASFLLRFKPTHSLPKNNPKTTHSLPKHYPFPNDRG